MNLSIRDQLQDKWAKEFIDAGSFGILHLCPRSGKIKTSINIFNILRDKVKRDPKILICYPDKNIEQSWLDNFSKFKYTNPNIEYTTHRSIEKINTNYYDIVVCDEIHLLSSKQKIDFRKLIKSCTGAFILGLSGTLSINTKVELLRDTGLNVINEYNLEEAINDGLISDYKINIIKVDLDNKVIQYPKKNRTEKAQYNAYTWVIETGKSYSLLLNLGRMRIIHNSLSKTESTIHLLRSRLKNKRVLVFCANNKIAKQLGCKIHTTKFNNQKLFDKFISGKGNNHMAVCKIGNTGVSFQNLDHIVINAFDSNSENLTQRICRSLILDTKNKVSNIYIITSTEKAELNWLNKSLEFFDKSKITYL